MAANRGEIALRIIRAIQELGHVSVRRIRVASTHMTKLLFSYA
ncbi:MAG: hypothetical protein MUO63_19900 [Desulfobulbaceae bacterium]|nr:hypothetical protein [Desulfobulbaceae bacterium]